MKDKYIVLTVGCVLSFFILLMGAVSAISPHNKTIERENYECGYEISHMDISKDGCYLSARNNDDSFIKEITDKTYAQFRVGEIIHVKVTVYEKGDDIYREYEILGKEDCD